MHMANSSAQITPVSVKFTSYPGMMVLKVIIRECTSTFLSDLARVNVVLVSHPAVARCRAPTCSANTTGSTGFTAFFRKYQQ